MVIALNTRSKATPKLGRSPGSRALRSPHSVSLPRRPSWRRAAGSTVASRLSGTGSSPGHPSVTGSVPPRPPGPPSADRAAHSPAVDKVAGVQGTVCGSGAKPVLSGRATASGVPDIGQKPGPAVGDPVAAAQVAAPGSSSSVSSASASDSLDLSVDTSSFAPGSWASFSCWVKNSRGGGRHSPCSSN